MTKTPAPNETAPDHAAPAADSLISQAPNYQSAVFSSLIAGGLFISLNYLLRRAMDNPMNLFETLFMAVFFTLLFGYFQYRAAKRSAFVLTAQKLTTSGGAEIALSDIVSAKSKSKMVRIKLSSGRTIVLGHIRDAKTLETTLNSLIGAKSA